MSFKIGDRVHWVSEEKYKGTVTQIKKPYIYVRWDDRPDYGDLMNLASHHVLIESQDGFEVDE